MSTNTSFDHAMLERVWKAVFPDVLYIEESEDVEGYGNERTINSTISLWPAMLDDPGTKTIANPNPEPTQRLGWRVGIIVPEYNYPHAPDGRDVKDHSEHFFFAGAVKAVVELWASVLADAEFDRMADDAYAEAIEQEEVP